ncbi:MAM and LDL-receptor class A domain-containing protein 1-like [Saccostrea echinata]|uniref:MAM and LDL-receptor class A domain-containing protein 1-like n=1 Tax=Saccostrea echinata TaxID=191078 RepID=UPI002A7F7328|nr:MAM and LDL-receptor class A domain-containing protein 1-like [Saccostrea echinata]
MSGTSYTGDIAIDQVNVTKGPCNAVLNSVNCDFESSTWTIDLNCGLSQSTSDRFDWTRYSGATGSSNTGPSSAAEGSYYLYIETSSQTSKANAVLNSKYLNTGHFISIASFYQLQWVPAYAGSRVGREIVVVGITSGDGACLYFKYHMYGVTINTLNINVSTNGFNNQRIWWRYGDQGNRWHQAAMTLPRSSSLRKHKFSWG